MSQVRERLGLSFHNVRALRKNLDRIPVGGGKWHEKELSFPDQPGEVFVVRHRDPIQVIKSLWGDPALTKSMKYAPTKCWINKDMKERVYNEMWTGDYWNDVQVRSGGC